MKKIIPMIIALLLIVVVGAVAFGGRILDKYSYSKELADLDEYYGVTDASVGAEVSGNTLTLWIELDAER